MRLREFVAMVTHDTFYAPKFKWTREYRAWLRNANTYTYFLSTDVLFQFYLVILFFFCGVCVTLLCPHSGRSKTVSFFWICIYNYAMDMQKRAKSLGAVYMFHVYSRWKVFNWLRLFAFRFFMINHIQNKLFSDFAATR